MITITRVLDDIINHQQIPLDRILSRYFSPGYRQRTYATRHRVLCTRRSGEEVDMEVYMFAEIDDSGRFIRIEEATLMLKGRESDKDLGSVR
ncbi:TPA: nuclear transport factor 2 family protein [Klebsiella pneumoniae]